MEWPGKLKRRLHFWARNENLVSGQDVQEQKPDVNIVSVEAVDANKMANSHKDEGQVRNGKEIENFLG